MDRTKPPRHPQLEVFSDTHYTEYRYYANEVKMVQCKRYLWHLQRMSIYVWLDALAIMLISYLWHQSHRSLTVWLFLVYAYWRCSRVIYESVIVLRPHGIQLETHRGPFKSLFVTRRFIPAVYIQDVIINEALRRWNVRYYLAVIVSIPGENRELVVAFENTLPQFPVLLEAYRGVNQHLYTEK